MERYGERRRFKRIIAPGLKDGRLGRVTIYERGAIVLLKWYKNGRSCSDTVKPSDYDNVMTEAPLRAAEINRHLSNGRSSPSGMN